MPQVFRIGSYLVYFWANEGRPLETVHVHIAEGTPSENATKVWITKSGKCLLCHNNSQIYPRILKNIIEIIESRNHDVTNKWITFFGEISFYC
jgi:hypothetical protein